MSLQFGSEFFNLFDHSNLYADPRLTLLWQESWRGGEFLRGYELYQNPFDRRNIQLGLC